MRHKKLSKIVLGVWGVIVLGVWGVIVLGVWV